MINSGKANNGVRQSFVFSPNDPACPGVEDTMIKFQADVINLAGFNTGTDHEIGQT
jgi:hypothetical protein